MLQKFERCLMGFCHVSIAKVHTAEGKLSLFIGIDRIREFAMTQLVYNADRKTAWNFLKQMLEAVPYQVHTFLPTTLFNSPNSKKLQHHVF